MRGEEHASDHAPACKPAASLRAPALAELAPALRIDSHRPSGNLATTFDLEAEATQPVHPHRRQRGYGALAPVLRDDLPDALEVGLRRRP